VRLDSILGFSLTAFPYRFVVGNFLCGSQAWRPFLVLCSRTNAFEFGLVLLATAFLLPACSTRNETVTTSEPPPRVESTVEPPVKLFALATPTPSPTPANKSSTPPNPTEIRDTVARVFEKAATPDPSRPGFAVGDFNGDGSEDLAVAVKPGENSLSEINNELANWLLEDPRTVVINTASTVRPPPVKPVRAEKGDSLLAIIHGVGPQGWRNPAAKQTFLLKNGAGSNMTVLAVKDLTASNGKAKLPPLRGDTISETVGGKAGILFWTGAKYAWHPSPE
jgi:hypothetical protein